jgi:hypothetical protein
VLALLTATIILLPARIEGKAKDSQGPAAPGVVEMQGAAIISNEPLQQLVRAIEADNVEGI